MPLPQKFNSTYSTILTSLTQTQLATDDPCDVNCSNYRNKLKLIEPKGKKIYSQNRRCISSKKEILKIQIKDILLIMIVVMLQSIQVMAHNLDSKNQQSKAFQNEFLTQEEKSFLNQDIEKNYYKQVQEQKKFLNQKYSQQSQNSIAFENSNYINFNNQQQKKMIEIKNISNEQEQNKQEFRKLSDTSLPFDKVFTIRVLSGTNNRALTPIKQTDGSILLGIVDYDITRKDQRWFQNSNSNTIVNMQFNTMSLAFSNQQGQGMISLKTTDSNDNNQNSIKYDDQFNILHVNYGSSNLALDYIHYQNNDIPSLYQYNSSKTNQKWKITYIIQNGLQIDKLFTIRYHTGTNSRAITPIQQNDGSYLLLLIDYDSTRKDQQWFQSSTSKTIVNYQYNSMSFTYQNSIAGGVSLQTTNINQIDQNSIIYDDQRYSLYIKYAQHIYAQRDMTVELYQSQDFNGNLIKMQLLNYKPGQQWDINYVGNILIKKPFQSTYVSKYSTSNAKSPWSQFIENSEFNSATITPTSCQILDGTSGTCSMQNKLISDKITIAADGISYERKNNIFEGYGPITFCFACDYASNQTIISDVITRSQSAHYCHDKLTNKSVTSQTYPYTRNSLGQSVNPNGYLFFFDNADPTNCTVTSCSLINSQAEISLDTQSIIGVIKAQVNNILGYSYNIQLQCKINGLNSNIISNQITIDQTQGCQNTLTNKAVTSQTYPYTTNSISQSVNPNGYLFFFHNADLINCPVTSCSFINSYAEISQDTSSYIGVIKAFTNKMSGYSYKIQFQCQIQDLPTNFVSDELNLNQITGCLNTLSKNTLIQTSQILPYEQSQSPQLINSNGWEQFYFNTDSLQCPILSCSLVYLYDEISLDILNPYTQGVILALTNNTNGYSYQIQLSCSTQGQILLSDFLTITQTSSCYNTLNLKPLNDPITFNYTLSINQQTVNQYGWKDIFENQDPQNCPITQCKLVNSEIEISLDMSSINIGIIKAMTNVEAGYSYKVQLQCQTSGQVESNYIRIIQIKKENPSINLTQTQINQTNGSNVTAFEESNVTIIILNNLTENSSNLDNENQTQNDISVDETKEEDQIQNSSQTKTNDEEKQNKTNSLKKVFDPTMLNQSYVKKKIVPIVKIVDKIVPLPLKILVDSFSPLGTLKLSFSETIQPLYIINVTKQFNLNFTSNAKNQSFLNATILKNNQDKFLNVTFIRKANYNLKETNQSTDPQLLNWYIDNFTQDFMTIQLNFSNKLYISKEQFDILQINFTQNKIYVTESSNISLEKNYILYNIKVEKQARSSLELSQMQTIRDTSSSSMLITLIFPLIFKIFAKLSMDNIWSFFNFLQILSNFKNMRAYNIRFPQNAQMIIDAVYNVCNFKLLAHPLIQEFLKRYIFGQFKELQNFLTGYDVTFLVIIVCLIVGALVLLLLCVFKESEYLLKLKYKIFWSSILKSLVQGYFPMSIYIFTQIMQMDLEKFQDLPNSVQASIVLKMIIIIILPIFCIIFLKKNQKSLNDETFKSMYGTLYTNLEMIKEDNQSYKYTSIFLIKRLILALTTTFFGYHFIVNVYIIIFMSIASLSYYVNYRPFRIQLFNRIEVVNDAVILFSSYFLIIFSDWIDNPELKYNAGWVFFYFLIVVILGNMVAIIVQTIIEQRKLRNESIFYDSWKGNIDKKFILITEIAEIIQKFSPDLTPDQMMQIKLIMMNNTNLIQLRQTLEFLKMEQMSQPQFQEIYQQALVIQDVPNFQDFQQQRIPEEQIMHQNNGRQQENLQQIIQIQKEEEKQQRERMLRIQEQYTAEDYFSFRDMRGQEEEQKQPDTKVNVKTKKFYYGAKKAQNSKVLPKYYI